MCRMSGYIKDIQRRGIEKLCVAVASFISPWTNEVISIAASCCSIHVSNQVHVFVPQRQLRNIKHTNYPQEQNIPRPPFWRGRGVNFRCRCVCSPRCSCVINGLPRTGSEEGLGYKSQDGTPAGVCRSLCLSDRRRRRARDSSTPWVLKLGKDGPRNFGKGSNHVTNYGVFI